jgi:hypothetical protein
LFASSPSSRYREVNSRVCYSLSAAYYALCLQPPLSVPAVNVGVFPRWYTHYTSTLHCTCRQQHLQCRRPHPPASSPRPTLRPLSPSTNTIEGDIRHTGTRDHRARLLEAAARQIAELLTPNQRLPLLFFTLRHSRLGTNYMPLNGPHAKRGAYLFSW